MAKSSLFWDHYAREWRVRLELDTDEAAYVAKDLGDADLGRLVVEAQERNESEGRRGNESGE